jgi:hypothetical protein
MGHLIISFGFGITESDMTHDNRRDPYNGQFDK